MKKIYMLSFLILWSINCYAESLPIINGAAWLSSNQNADGSWGAKPDLSFVHTAEAVTALITTITGSTNYISGITWIASQDITSTDEISRKIVSLASNGTDITELINIVLSVRNSGGGWGYNSGTTSNSLDTALALQALKAANYSDTIVLYQAINFLISYQNSDGGWGFRPANGMISADESNVYVTAIALRAITGFSSTFNVSSSIQKASVYLLSKQNADGGFDSTPSNVYETALAFLALIESGQGSTTQLQNAVSYLTSTQLSNGSWNDDPYSTALALQALASVKPNLSISSPGIALSKSIPAEGESVTITATVRNAGLEDATDVVVRFFQGDPRGQGAVQIGTDQLIPMLALGASADVSVSHVFTGTGSRSVFVQVDPDNQVNETSEADNIASRQLWVATLPDLAIFSEDLKPSTYVPASGTAFTLEYSVRNLGESATGAFTVRLYDGDPAQGGTVLQTATISGLNGIESRMGTFGVTLATDGSHTLYLTADSGSQIAELSETNNTGAVTVQVGGVQQQADLLAGMIELAPSRPRAGDTVQVTAHVRNQGTEPANDFLVEIYDGSPESQGTLLQTQTVSLAAGAEQTTTMNWTISSGIHDLYVIADRSNTIAETNETNNRASIKVMTDMVDISLSATDLVLNPSRPVSGDSVVLSITAHNSGIMDTGAFNLALYNGDPATGGVLLQEYPVANIAGDGSVTLTHTFTAEVRTYQFYALADTTNMVTELYEENNNAIRSLTIKGPGETYGPDLVPVKIDLTDTTTNPQTLAISGSAHVTFQNKGDDKITSSFNVMVFEDKDLNGQYTPGMDTVLGTGTNTTSLWPEGAGLVNVALSGTVTFLHSPLYALIDSDDSVLEQNETNNLLISCNDCEKRPANPIEPVVEWRWNQASPIMYGRVSSPALVAHLEDTNSDGKMDRDDIPTILVSSHQVTNNLVPPTLIGLRGNTGQPIFFSSYTAYWLAANSEFFTTGDLDNDGSPEIIGASRHNSLIAFNRDGTPKWDNNSSARNWEYTHPGQYITTGHSAITLADIDNNGKPEIIVGSMVFNNDGSMRWFGRAGRGAFDTVSLALFSSIADIDLDGNLDVVAGKTAYKNDGTTMWTAPVGDGVTAVGNFDDDPYPEIVLVTRDPYPTLGSKIYLLEHDGRIKWGPIYAKDLEPDAASSSIMYAAGVPLIADFDGDGEAEIGIKGIGKYIILDRSGSVKQTLITPKSPLPGSTNYSSPTVFDLNGDGRPEVIIAGEQYFRIFDGRSGAELYNDRLSTYGALNNYQKVTVADVDGDGHSEIIVTDMKYVVLYGWNLVTEPYGDTVRVYGAKNNDWTKARKIWPQADYHITNASDDGSIPQYESPHWLLNNSTRCQAAIASVPNPYLTPNLTASRLEVLQKGSAIDLSVRIGNGGAKEASEGATVTFYDGNPAGGGSVIGTASTTRALNPGEFQDVIYSWSNGSLGLHNIYAVVDAENIVPECREDDNQASVEQTINPEYADFTIASEDILLSAEPYHEGLPVMITANVRNIGAGSATSIIVRLYNGNPAAGGVQIGTDYTIPTINAGSSFPVVFTYDTIGRSGTNVLYVVVDPNNGIAETSESNNTAFIMLSVEPPMLPDLSIALDDIQLAPESPSEGDKLVVSATIHNFGTETSNIPVFVYLGDPASGGLLVSHQTIYPIMGFNTTAVIQATIDTTDSIGQQQIYVVTDPANTITESREDNNTSFKPVFIQSAGLVGAISLDKTSYQADETLTVNISAKDSSNSSRALTLSLFVQDSAGNQSAVISAAEPITVNANSATTLSRSWNTGSALNGQYTVTAEISESGRVVSRKSAGFTISPDTRMTAVVVTDKISYNPNETAALSTTITSQSRNYVFENLSATLQISSNGLNSSNGSIIVETKTISSIMPGALYTFKSYWNTGASSPGTYSAVLQVLSGDTVVSSATKSFELSASSRTGAGVTGTITAGPNPVYQGREETLTYSIKNTGNEDLTGIYTTIIIVDPDTGEAKAEYNNQHAAGKGASITDVRAVSTSGLAPRVYLAVLQVRTAEMAEPKTLASASFEVKPGIEITKNIPDIKNLLVWVNDGCEGHGPESNCARIGMIEQALTESGAAYRIVTDKKDFQVELRNPLYTDFMILGDRHPIEDHFSEELREQVFAGKGLISSLFTRQNLDSEVLGITHAGSVPGSDYMVEFGPGSFGIQGTFPSYGKAANVKAENADDTLAWIIEDSAKGRILHPAVVGQKYGRGKTLFFAFDLAMCSRTPIPFTALLKASLNYIHTPYDPALLNPNQLVPVEIAVKSLGAAFDVKIREIYPGNAAIYDPATGAWITQNPWERTLELSSGQTVTTIYYMRVPDAPGTHALRTETGYVEDGNYIPYQTIESQITAGRSTAEVMMETLSSLQPLDLKGTEAAGRGNAVKYIKSARNRIVLTQEDREAMIADLLKAAGDLKRITSTDISNARQQVNLLLLYWEAEWYYHEPVLQLY